MGRAGIEPATLGLKGPVRGLGTLRHRWKCAAEHGFLAHMKLPRFRPISEARVITLLTPSLPAAAYLEGHDAPARAQAVFLARVKLTGHVSTAALRS